MATKLEEKVRELDDESRNIAENAREISGRLGTNFNTTEKWLSAKRNNFPSRREYEEHLATKRVNPDTGEKFKSRSEYLEHLATKRVNPDTGEKFKSYSEYLEHLARQAGYKSHWEHQAKNNGCENWGEYLEKLAMERGCLDYNEYRRFINNRQDGEEFQEYLQRTWDEDFYQGDFKFIGKEELDSMVFVERDYFSESEENKGKALAAMGALNERERKIIYARFIEERRRTLREIGEKEGLSGERVRQLEQVVLGKMREYLQGVY